MTDLSGTVSGRCGKAFVKRLHLFVRHNDKPTPIQTVSQKTDPFPPVGQAAHGALDFESNPLDAAGACIGAAIFEQILDIEPDMSGQGL
ncbi:hypothetical protein EMQ_1948 [Acetobacter aceti NBRC 14818]|uniref:Uncharacterized protein n=1 Tax=Acetobacter aceti NBRC 14818 TaxID=887700 RepID=A0AB33IEK2_ACEAC|nr:hypothetical protein EMQ_1948 [Acetobacter aceti NBRC 14818]GAN58903.1 hypothetical protein Abac_107_012 [Acetobacter aceti NBRC 14818]